MGHGDTAQKEEREGSPNSRGSGGSPARRLTKEDVEKLTTRVYSQAIDAHKTQIEQLDHKYYQMAEPKVLLKDQMEASVARQSTAEMERRSKRNVELSTKHYHDEDAKRLSQAELDESIGRVYSDAIRQNKLKMEQLNTKYRFKNSSAGRKISKEDGLASGARLATPKKKVFSTEEINKVYGF